MTGRQVGASNRRYSIPDERTDFSFPILLSHIDLYLPGPAQPTSPIHLICGPLNPCNDLTMLFVARMRYDIVMR